MSPEPMDKREYQEYGEHSGMEIDEDKVAKRQNEIKRITGLIWLVFGVLETLIGIRVILKVIAANPDSSLTSFIYSASHVFLAPFFGVVGEPTSNGNVLEATSIIAMVVYLLIAWGITRIVYLVMIPSEVKHVKTMIK